MRLWAMTRVLLLLLLANGAPVVAKKILATRFSRPIDSGTRGYDGQPLFGDRKLSAESFFQSWPLQLAAMFWDWVAKLARCLEVSLC
jgi:hypothetical protein